MHLSRLQAGIAFETNRRQRQQPLRLAATQLARII
jgi:hypothetical protein